MYSSPLRPRPRPRPRPASQPAAAGAAVGALTPLTSNLLPGGVAGPDELTGKLPPRVPAQTPAEQQAYAGAFGHAMPAEMQQQSLKTLAPAVNPTGPRGFQRVASATGAAVGGAAASVGSAIKENPMGAVNAGLGIAGAIINATAKTPEVPAYQDFTPNLAPAQGMNTGVKAQLLARITANQTRAGAATSTDANLTAATRLAAAATAGQQQQQVEQQDQQILQQSQERRGQQQLQVDQTNHAGRTGRQMAVFEQKNRAAQTQKQTGTAMVQGATTYLAQSTAAGKQAEQAKIEQNNQVKRGRYQTLLGLMADPALAPAQRQQYNQELEALRAEAAPATNPVAKRRRGGLVPTFGKGGSVSSKSVLSYGTKHSDPTQQVMATFTRSLSTLTNQAQRLMADTLRDVFRARTRPLSSH